MPQNDQTLNTIEKWYDFAVQQVAAESSWHLLVDLSPEQILQRGNSPLNPTNPEQPPDQYVRLTQTQAVEFLRRYQIVGHHANDASGFSATVLFDTEKSQYTLAIRSTEYKNPSQGGDYDRDGYAGAGGQIRQYGFAIAQLAALEEYYKQLRAPSGVLEGEGAINVVGYSLGGHLALVFTELHPDDLIHTYALNAAGRGQLVSAGNEVEKIRQMLSYYREVLDNPRAADLGPILDNPNAFASALQLFQRDGTDHRLLESAAPGESAMTRLNIYSDSRHYWAMMAVAARYAGEFGAPIFSSPSPAGSPSYTQPEKVTQLFGHANHGDGERVANSGIHPEATHIYIEGQPYIEGLIGKLPNAPEWTQWLSKYGSFGNTHSLTLIIDSLALMEAFMSVDPTLDKRQVESIFAAASNARARRFFTPQGDGRINAEADSLEAALDALRKLYGAAGFNGSNPGEAGWATPADPKNGGFGIIANREIFYQHLALLEQQVIAKDRAFIIPLVPAALFSEVNGEPVGNVAQEAIQAELIGLALRADGVAYRYALKELNPFVAEANPGLYASHSGLALGDNTAGVAGMSRSFIEDRAAMLAWKLEQSVANRQHSLTADPISVKYVDQATGKSVYVFSPTRAGAALTNEDKFGPTAGEAHARTFGNAIAGGAARIVVFGSDSDELPDTLRGAQSPDRLYGQAGNDKLLGFAGNDRLEGGRGDDTLDGGLGFDTYVWNVGDGFDTITDVRQGPDNLKLGAIELLGAAVAGQKQQLLSSDPRLYTDASGYLYVLTGTRGAEAILTILEPGGGGVRILGFRSGDFGILLPAPETMARIDVFGTNEGEILAATADGQRILGLGGDDRISLGGFASEAWGGPGNDIIRNGPGDQQLYGEEGRDVLIASGGNDELYGGTEDDALQGGADDDYLEGNEGNDLLAGGLGFDVLDGGEGDDYLFGGASYEATSPDWTVSFAPDGNISGFSSIFGVGSLPGDGGDLLYGGAGNDYLFGGEGDDYLDGEDGDDWIVGEAGSDFLLGGAGNDRLFGDAGYVPAHQHGDDYLDGGDGDDELQGGFGADVLFGGAGADRLFGDDGFSTSAQPGDGADYLDGGDGDDYLRGQGGDDVLIGGAGNDILLGEAGADDLYGDDGDDQLFGDLESAPLEEQGDDYLDGGAGNDYLEGFGGDDLMFGGTGNDVLYGGAGDDLLDGEEGDDQLFGGEGDDLIFGGAGDDLLFGGAGNDLLSGGSGADTYFYDLGGGVDQIVDGAGEGNRLQFGPGILFSDVTLGLGSLRIDLPGGGEIHIEGFDPANAESSAVIDTFSFDDAPNVPYAQLLAKGIRIIGTPAADVLIGTSVRDFIDGGDGADALFGGAGNDRLRGGAGADLLVGGAGDDIYEIDSVADALEDEIVELPDGGLDMVISTVSFDMARAPEVEILQLAGEDAIDGTGDARDNTILGNASNNVLLGGEGSDVLVGGLGNDVLLGGEGDDRLDGGGQDDRLDGGPGNDFLYGFGGDDSYVLAPGGGQDRVVEETFDLAGEPVGGRDAIALAAGVAPQDVTMWRDLAHLYVSLPSGDSLIVENNYARHPVSGLAGSVEVARFADGTEWDELAFQQQVRAVAATEQTDTLYAGAATDVLRGLGGDDRIFGFAGDDVLEGGPGNDYLSGGDGNDVYLFGLGSGRDVIDDFDFQHRFIPGVGNISLWWGYDYGFAHSAGEVDTVRLGPGITAADLAVTRVGGSLILGVNATADALVLAGWAQDDPFEANFPDRLHLVEFFDGTVWDRATVRAAVRVSRGTDGDDWLDGTAWADTILGLGGNDRIFGHEGDDLLDGGPGDDYLQGGEGADTYRFALGGGHDRVENFLASGAGDRVLIVGEDAADLLTLGTQTGMLHVRLGAADTLTVTGFFSMDDPTNPKRFDPANLAEVALEDGRYWDLSGILQALHTGGAGNDSLLGTYNADVLIGNAGDDWLSGELGDDVLDGGPGNDILDGGKGNDTYLFGRGSGEDLVFESFVFGDAAANRNRVRIGAGLRPEDIIVAGSADPTSLYIRGTSDAIRFLGGSIPEVEFADGTLWTLSAMRGLMVPEAATAWFGGTAGSNAADTLLGTPQNDAIWALAGDDVIGGGAGDDRLSGGTGNDLYLFSPGDGRDRIDQGDSGFLDHDRIQLGAGILPAQVYAVLKGNDLHVRFSNPADALVLADWVSRLEFRIDELVFADGTIWNAAALEARMVREGTPGNDVLTGGSGPDILYGLEGDDVLDGGAGDDILDGGPGNDHLIGGAGSDTYRFGRGYGQDTVNESDTELDFNRVEIAADVLPAEISVSALGTGGVTLSIAGTGDALLLPAGGARPGGFPGPGPGPAPGPGPGGSAKTVDQILFLADGTVWDGATLTQRIGTIGTAREVGEPAANRAPVLVSPLADASMLQGELAWYRIPGSAFADPDAADTLTYSVQAAAPGGWFRFNAETRTLIATPGQAAIGEHQFVVTATDAGGLSASGSFVLTVENVNDAPFLAVPLMDLRAAPRAALDYRIPERAFADVDPGDSLTFAATFADGSALPEWLSFDAGSRTLAGLPLDAHIGSYEIRVTASDQDGLQASDIFSLTVADRTDESEPIVLDPIADQSALEDAPFSLQLPADATGMVWSASRADGSPLPSWLRFFAGPRTFSGTPDNDAVGESEIRLTAIAAGGASASTAFRLTVVNVNDAPAVLNAIPDQVAQRGVAFSLVLPQDSFFDPDVGDKLYYESGPLPAWLAFDPETRTFAGTPGKNDIGAFEIAVTARDQAGAEATDAFLLAVVEGSAPPVVAAPLADAAALEDQGFAYLIPAGTFLDPDGDVLAFSTSALPAWLQFDAAAASFSGVPGNADVGTVLIAVTATDTTGLNAVDTFELQVVNINDAPTASGSLADIAGREMEPLAFQVPLAVFVDIDAGDVLAFSAGLGGGAALPGWLSFDPGSGTFLGMPGSADGGEYVIRVVATDLEGAPASIGFGLAIADARAGDGCIIGTDEPDVLNGLGGDDCIAGLLGADRLYGGGGNDLLHYSADQRWHGHDTALNVATGSTEKLAGRTRTLDWYDGGAGWDTLLGTDGHDALLLDDGADEARIKGIEHILTGPGNDLVDLTSARFTYGDVILDGGAGNDTLWAAAGNDILLGGAGNDMLAGGAGMDIYVYELHGGHDVIEEAGGDMDTLVFGEGIAAGAVRFARRGSDLCLEISGANGSVTVRNWFASAAARVERIEFADGTVWDIERALGALVDGVAGAPSFGIAGEPPAGSKSNQQSARARTGQQAENDPAADFVAARPAGAPYFDFERLLQALDVSPAAPALSADEIARRWADTAHHAESLASEIDADAQDLGLAWRDLFARRSNEASQMACESAIGLVHGVPRLESFRGLSEGLQSL